MKNRFTMAVAIIAIILVQVICAGEPLASVKPSFASAGTSIELPAPRMTGAMPVEEALKRRRSVRRYEAVDLTPAEIGQLLWAAQGMTDPRGLRTAPSAGGIFPLEVWLAAGRVAGLAAGLYRYEPQTHRLVRSKSGDVRGALAAACMNQPWIRDAGASIVFVADPSRMSGRYGARTDRYIDMEIGHASQNVYLQATAMNLGTVAVGACDGDTLRRIMGLRSGEDVRYVMPVGPVR